jgi:heme o synthase
MSGRRNDELMMESPTVDRSKITSQKSAYRFPFLLISGLFATFMMLVLSHIMRLGQSGEWVIPIDTTVRMVSFFRALAWVSAGLITISAVEVHRSFRHQKMVNIPLYLSSVLAVALIPASALPEPAVIALRLAVLGLGLVSVTAWFISRKPSAGEVRSLSLSSPFGKLALATLLAVFVLMVSGTAVSIFEANRACSGWPLCSGWLPSDGLGWLAFSHRLVTLVAGLLVTAMFVRSWRSQRSEPVILTAATTAFVLFVGEILVGAVMTLRAFSVDLVWLHAISAVALWGSLVILVTAVAFAARTVWEETDEAAQPLPVGRRLKDFILLSKPIIVLLLLVTTYAGMVVGGKGIPTLALTFWTMLGGALAAGGSSALNQFIDREIDKAMQRTAKRPLPDGRLTPAEGVAYGAGAVVLSFFLLASFVNLIAALLSLAGAVYYVLLYSIWLKRLTVQNIVIGGGAGAIPPLVGWAAASEA